MYPIARPLIGESCQWRGDTAGCPLTTLMVTAAASQNVCYLPNYEICPTLAFAQRLYAPRGTRAKGPLLASPQCSYRINSKPYLLPVGCLPEIVSNPFAHVVGYLYATWASETRKDSCRGKSMGKAS